MNKHALIIVALLFLPWLTPRAQSQGVYKIKPSDRFVRLINLIEPNLEKPWRAGVNLIVAGVVRVNDSRSGEGGGYIHFQKEDFKKEWLVQVAQFPDKKVNFDLQRPELEDAAFITIFCTGAISDSKVDISATAKADKVSSETQTSIRYLDAIKSYPIQVSIDGKEMSASTTEPIVFEHPPGRLKATVKWVDSQKRQREQESVWETKIRNSYTITASNTGGKFPAPRLMIWEESANAKAVVERLGGSKSETKNNPVNP